MFHEQTHNDSKVYSLSRDGEDCRLSGHFTLEEFRCRDGSDIVVVHPQLIELLEVIRLKLKAPIHILSGYRSHTWNKQIGGAKHSQHLLGMAADIASPTKGVAEIHSAALSFLPGGVGRYTTFVHVDVFGKDRRWHG